MLGNPQLAVGDLDQQRTPGGARLHFLTKEVAVGGNRTESFEPKGSRS